MENGNVSDSVKSINMQSQLTPNISPATKTGATQEKLIQTNSQTLICSVAVFRAKAFQLLEKGRVSKIQEALYSMKSAESWQSKDLNFCFSKMSKGCSQQTLGGVSQQSSHRWMNWGMMSNGKFLTQNILESRRIGKECSLSDILEANPADKYFLSEQMTKRLMTYKDNKLSAIPSLNDTKVLKQQGAISSTLSAQEVHTPSERMLLNVNSMHKR